MTVTSSARFGLVLWSDDDDPWTRAELVANFAALEAQGARLVDLAAEATARAAAVAGESTARATAIAAEATTRAAAITALNTAVTAEGTARTTGLALKLNLTGGTLTGALAGTDLTLSGALSLAGALSAPDGTVNVTGNLEVATALTEAGARVATRAYVDTAVGNTSTTTTGNLNDHKNDTSDSHMAATIGYLGSTDLVATTVEAALDELDAEKLGKAGGTLTGNLTLASGIDLVVSATTGSRIGQAGSRLAFYGATPVLRPGTYSVDASTATNRSLPAYTADSEATAYAGEAAALADAATRSDLNSLRVAVENLRAYTERVGSLAAANTRDLITVGLLG